MTEIHSNMPGLPEAVRNGSVDAGLPSPEEAARTGKGLAGRVKDRLAEAVGSSKASSAVKDANEGAKQVANELTKTGELDSQAADEAISGAATIEVDGESTATPASAHIAEGANQSASEIARETGLGSEEARDELAELSDSVRNDSSDDQHARAEQLQARLDLVERDGNGDSDAAQALRDEIDEIADATAASDAERDELAEKIFDLQQVQALSTLEQQAREQNIEHLRAEQDSIEAELTEKRAEWVEAGLDRFMQVSDILKLSDEEYAESLERSHEDYQAPGQLTVTPLLAQYNAVEAAIEEERELIRLAEDRANEAAAQLGSVHRNAHSRVEDRVAALAQAEHGLRELAGSDAAPTTDASEGAQAAQPTEPAFPIVDAIREQVSPQDAGGAVVLRTLDEIEAELVERQGVIDRMPHGGPRSAMQAELDNDASFEGLQAALEERTPAVGGAADVDLDTVDPSDRSLYRLAAQAEHEAGNRAEAEAFAENPIGNLEAFADELDADDPARDAVLELAQEFRDRQEQINQLPLPPEDLQLMREQLAADMSLDAIEDELAERLGAGDEAVTADEAVPAGDDNAAEDTTQVEITDEEISAMIAEERAAALYEAGGPSGLGLHGDAVAVTVQPGQNLSQITSQLNQAYGTNLSWRDLHASAEAGGTSIPNPDLIFPGQVLVIPAVIIDEVDRRAEERLEERIREAHAQAGA